MQNEKSKVPAKLTLILAEAALETIPRKLWRHPSVQSHSRRRGKPPRFLLLDRSYHHAAMKGLENAEKRGRPDIVHFSLLEALGSPLNRESLLHVYVHTVNDFVITIDSETRLPRNYDRFVGLMEQLFELGRVPPTGPVLLRLERRTLAQLLNEIRPSYVVVFTDVGLPKTLEAAISSLSRKGRLVFIVGCFPRGQFSEETMKLADEAVCIDPETLDAWTVVSRVIYEYERAISLPSRRLKQVALKP